MSTLFDSFNGETDYGCGAELSPDGLYRYTLTREWDDGRCVAWLMFNPSTADADQDDATIRKCVGFSKFWGYGRLVVVNLFAIRSRDPKSVARVVDPIGPLNDYWIKEATSECREVVCAWGCSEHIPPKFAGRINHVTDLIPEHVPTVCLGRRNDGSPRHPLILAYKTERVPYFRETEAKWCPDCTPDGTCQRHAVAGVPA